MSLVADDLGRVEPSSPPSEEVFPRPQQEEVPQEDDCLEDEIISIDLVLGGEDPQPP